jgi:hypothetical protein
VDKDRLSASWVLVVGSILVGVWYWRLSPADKRARLSGAGAGADPAGLSVAPPSKTEPLYNPTIGKDGLTDEERAHLRSIWGKRSASPADLGRQIGAAIEGFWVGKHA